MRQTFEIPLDIPDVTIEHVTTNPLGHIEITVKSTMVGTPCRQCGEMTTKFYGEDREIRLRHLPILGRQTYICLRPKRYECPNCDGKPTTTQQLGWYTPRSSFTRAYEEQLLLSLVNSTIQDVSIKEEIGYEAIMGVIDRHLDREINWEDITQFTQKIESKHINLRTRIKRLVRRTICFSKTEQMHDLVIGLFVNRYEFGLLL